MGLEEAALPGGCLHRGLSQDLSPGFCSPSDGGPRVTSSFSHFITPMTCVYSLILGFKSPTVDRSRDLVTSELPAQGVGRPALSMRLQIQHKNPSCWVIGSKGLCWSFLLRSCTRSEGPSATPGLNHTNVFPYSSEVSSLQSNVSKAVSSGAFMGECVLVFSNFQRLPTCLGLWSLTPPAIFFFF